MEGKEMVRGYLMCKANDYAAAIEIAKSCPILVFDDGKVEIREIQEMKMLVLLMSQRIIKFL
jgi:hypothetical protein